MPTDTMIYYAYHNHISSHEILICGGIYKIIENYKKYTKTNLENCK